MGFWRKFTSEEKETRVEYKHQRLLMMVVVVEVVSGDDEVAVRWRDKSKVR